MNSYPPSNRLAIRMLGSLEIKRADETPVRISYEKGRAILAYLAAEREETHTRQKLADIFWPDLPSEAARSNLRLVLLDLRQALNDTVSPFPSLLASRSTVGLNPDGGHWFDIADFTKLAAGISDAGDLAQMEYLADLYRGEFMAGFSLPDCPEFEDWLLVKREAIHRHALALLERLSACHENAGNFGKALPFALRHVALDTWNEEAQRRAMRLFALNGQLGAALSQYDSLCRALDTELGVQPARETRELAERIRTGNLIAETRTSPPEARPLPPLVAERRQVTVLYCELSLPDAADPDEAAEQLQAPQERCIATIKRFSGHLVQTHGGGLLAYFGYPQASEIAARLAVEAALAVVSESAAGIEVRAGVHTGLIITGDDPSVPDTIGATSGLAIRLRLVVENGEVALSADTHRIVAGYFDCEGLGHRQLRGIARPVDVFRVTAKSGALTRLEAADTLTPLVGRSAELEKLLTLWEKARSGERQIVLLRGEAGIGKSRLIRALQEHLHDASCEIRELHCLPEFKDSAFHPVVALLEARLGLSADDTPESQFLKLRRYASQYFPQSEHKAVPLIAALLSLPLPEPYRMPVSTTRRTEIATLLMELLQSSAARKPMLLVLEDIHWIDPSTLELLKLLVSRHSPLPVLVLVSSRPSFTPPWGKDAVSSMELAPLSNSEVATMVSMLDQHLHSDVVGQIVARADGVPLFVEEISRMAGHAPERIPITLHDLLTARLDSMGEQKQIAQLAATIGREFSFDLLQLVCPLARGALEQGLRKLKESGLVLGGTDRVFQFKHALIQEAAYQSQTKIARQATHRHIAQALQAHFSHIAEVQPEILAQHLSDAGEAQQAIEYWIKAGERATRHAFNAEAAAHLRAGLQLLDELPAGALRDALEFRLQVNLGSALYFAKGLASVEAGQAYLRAVALCREDDVSPNAYRALCGLWAHSITSSHQTARHLAGRLLDLAQRSGDPVQLQQANYAMAHVLLWTGEFEAAQTHAAHAVALYDPAQHEDFISQFGENVCVAAGSFQSLALWYLGFPDQARAVSAQIVSLARQLAHPYTLGFALNFATVLYRLIGQADEARALAKETLELAQQHNFGIWLATGTLFHYWELAMQGQFEGVVSMQRAIDAIRAAAGAAPVASQISLINGYRHFGEFDAALQVIDEAMSTGRVKGDYHAVAELQRIKGECLLGLSVDNTAQAEACFMEAIEVSRQQGAKSYELRVVTSLCRLKLQQGAYDQARRLLEDIYSWFTEGFDTPDLCNAQDLLEQLARCDERIDSASTGATQ